MSAVADSALLDAHTRLNAWFAARGWEAFAFQRDVWSA